MYEAPDRAALKRQARDLLQTAQVSPKGMTALYCGVTLLFNLLDYAVSQFASAGAGPELLSTFVSFFTSLAGWVLTAGFAVYCMGIRQREEMGYGSLFDGFSFTGKIIALNFVINFYVFLWSLLFIVPGFIAYYRYRFAYYHLYENPGMNILEALELSKRQTQGMKMELFKLDLSYLGWILLSSLPAIVIDSRMYLQLFNDPSALLTSGSTLPEILLCGIWSLVVSLFFLPHYQCVLLEYFDTAKAGTPDRRSFPGGTDGF